MGEGAPPPCVICGHSGRGPRARRDLTHGVCVWLCDLHAGDAFTTRRCGMEFAERLAAVWAAAGVANARRTAALDTHIRRIRNAGASRNRPGSYAWPSLRQEAERRFATGESPNAVITELRRDFSGGPSTIPSIGTMRRWFRESR